MPAVGTEETGVALGDEFGMDWTPGCDGIQATAIMQVMARSRRRHMGSAAEKTRKAVVGFPCMESCTLLMPKWKRNRCPCTPDGLPSVTCWASSSYRAFKSIARQKLYRLESGNPDADPRLQPVLTRPIRWEVIRQQYDELIKYATAVRLGTADAESILRRFYPRRAAAPDLPGARRDRPGRQNDLPVPLSAPRGPAPGDP